MARVTINWVKYIYYVFYTAWGLLDYTDIRSLFLLLSKLNLSRDLLDLDAGKGGTVERYEARS